MNYKSENYRNEPLLFVHLNISGNPPSQTVVVRVTPIQSTLTFPAKLFLEKFLKNSQSLVLALAHV